MFRLICKSLPQTWRSICSRTSPTYKYHFLQFNSLSKEAAKPISENTNKHSFTVNYLIHKCGFAPEKAISASKHLKFNKPDKPDAVRAFFESQGFSETQFLKLIKRRSQLLVYDPENTLLPKIEFLLSKGLSKAELTEMLLIEPAILTRNLESCLIPCFDFLENFLGSDQPTTKALVRCPQILPLVQSRVKPKIETLQEAGVSDDRIAYLLRTQPNIFTRSSEGFKESVDQVKNMGIDPMSSNFVAAVSVSKSLSGLTWFKKVEAYRRWGCSEDEVLMAFKNNPSCMMASEDKIEGMMSFFVNEFGWRPSMLMQNSQILSLSLKKRVMPRCSVYQVLLSKGLITEETSVCGMLICSDVLFLDKFVNCYQEEAPELLKLYEERLTTAEID